MADPITQRDKAAKSPANILGFGRTPTQSRPDTPDLDIPSRPPSRGRQFMNAIKGAFQSKPKEVESRKIRDIADGEALGALGRTAFRTISTPLFAMSNDNTPNARRSVDHLASCNARDELEVTAPETEIEAPLDHPAFATSKDGILRQVPMEALRGHEKVDKSETVLPEVEGPMDALVGRSTSVTARGETHHEGSMELRETEVLETMAEGLLVETSIPSATPQEERTRGPVQVLMNAAQNVELKSTQPATEDSAAEITKDRLENGKRTSRGATGEPAEGQNNEPRSRVGEIARSFLKGSLGMAATLAPDTFKGPFEAALKAFEVIERVDSNKEDVKILKARCDLLKKTIFGAIEGKAEISGGLEEKLVVLLRGINHALKGANQETGILAYVLAEGNEEAIKKANQQLEELLQNFQIGTQIASEFALNEQTRNIQVLSENQSLGRLKQVSTAAYDSQDVIDKIEPCLEGTRTTTLAKINQWISDLDSKTPIFILDGIAGIGKSTVAQTVAQCAAGTKTLGFSFFFSRDSDDRKKTMLFVQTMAYQLAHYDASYGKSIAAALDLYADILGKDIKREFRHLIVEPLKALLEQRTGPLVFVLDALDECIEPNASTLLKLLLDMASSTQLHLPKVKIFLTTRPEQRLKNIYQGVDAANHVCLHEIEDELVEADIQQYFDHCFSPARVKEALGNQDGDLWQPTIEEKAKLVQLSGKLFIFASTAVKFILHPVDRDPRGQLAEILKMQSNSTELASEFALMDALYAQILCSILPRNRKAWFDDYNLALGAIIVLQHAISVGELADLLQKEPIRLLRVLDNLHSVLAPTPTNGGPNAVYKVHHKSFVDFITNSGYCNPEFPEFPRFLIKEKTHHLSLAEHCLNTMNNGLHFNICELSSQDCYKNLLELPVEELRSRYIPQKLVYACLYWASHLQQSEIQEPDADKAITECLKAFEVFANCHLMHWLEVLSYIGQVDVASLSLTQAIAVAINKSLAIASVLADGQRFIMLNGNIIHHSPLHIYWSCLSLAPTKALLHSQRPVCDMHAVGKLGIDTAWPEILAVLRGPLGLTRDAEFSPSKEFMLAASDGKNVCLWDSRTGSLSAVLQAHKNRVQSIAFSPNGMQLASASIDKQIVLWDCASPTPKLYQTLKGHSGSVERIIFSPNAEQQVLASASADKTVRIWDTSTGNLLKLHKLNPKHSALAPCISFASDGEILAFSEHKTVCLWNIQSKLLCRLEGHSHLVQHVEFSPREDILASASDDQTIRLWKGETGECLHVLEGHTGRVNHIAFGFPDSKSVLASASADRTIRLWNAESGEKLDVLWGHSKSVLRVAFATHNHTLTLASSSEDKTIHLWNIVPSHGASHLLAILKSHSQGVPQITFAPDGQKLASVSRDGTVRLWDTSAISPHSSGNSHSGSVEYIAFSPAGGKLVSSADDGTVKLWDTITQTNTHFATIKHNLAASAQQAIFSYDGKILALASNDRTVQLWDYTTGTPQVSTLDPGSGPVQYVAFSHDGAQLVSISGIDYEATHLWDTTSGTKVVELVDSKGVCYAQFSPNVSNLKVLALALKDSSVHLWSGETGKELSILKGHSNAVLHLAFSSDGKRLVSASEDRTLCLWNLEAYKMAMEFKGHLAGVDYAIFSADNQVVASASRDKTVRLWNLEGACLASFQGHCTFPISVTSHQFVLYVKQEDPSVAGIAIITIRDSGPTLDPVCWLPSNWEVTAFSVSATDNLAAVGCSNGRVCILDISQVAKLLETNESVSVVEKSK